ncbi:MAG: energy transducer TonB [Sphingobacteriales bacterium]|nr:MAG: energy transducer TonB [Sphingobacteriales bacterium]
MIYRALAKWAFPLLLVFGLLGTEAAFGQRAEKTHVLSDTYFKDKTLRKQTEASNATARQTAAVLPNGDIEYTVAEWPSGKVLSNEIIAYEEPFYTRREGKTTIDYNFPLVYAAVSPDTLAAILVGDYGKPNPTAGYESPKVTGKSPDINYYLAQQVNYPGFAREGGISGKVVVQFKVNRQGETQDVAIVRGVHPSLDKETMRVFRIVRFAQPAMWNGEPYTGTLTVPVKYLLE